MVEVAAAALEVDAGFGREFRYSFAFKLLSAHGLLFRVKQCWWCTSRLYLECDRLGCHGWQVVPLQVTPHRLAVKVWVLS